MLEVLFAQDFKVKYLRSVALLPALNPGLVLRRLSLWLGG